MNDDGFTLESSKAIARPIFLLDEQARDKAGMPPEWAPFRYEAKEFGHPIPKFTEIEGAVAPPLKSGPSKGQPNWKALDKTTLRTVRITFDEQETWQRAWEVRTGQCRHCVGTGERFASWSKAEGTKMRPCRDCGGTGKPKEAAR